MTGQSDLRALTLEGSELLARLGDLDDLHRSQGVPITSRRRWLEAWARAYPHFRPWGVFVEHDGGVHGAALLARRRRAGRTEVLSMGHGPSDYSRLPARSDAAAEALARAVADALARVRGPWSLRIERLPEDEGVALRLIDLLPVARLEPDEGAPRVGFDGDRDPRSLMRKNARRTEREGWNRARREGAAPSLGVLETPADVEAALDRLERIRHERDLARLGSSTLSDPSFRRFWRSIIPELAAAGELEVLTLSLHDELAAFTLCFRDGASYRTWDGRFDERFSRYSPGRLSDLAAFRRALSDRRYEEFDFMRGAHGYKLELGGRVVPSVTLAAWSSRLTSATLGAGDQMRSLARRFASRYPSVRGLRDRVRRWARR